MIKENDQLCLPVVSDGVYRILFHCDSKRSRVDVKYIMCTASHDPGIEIIVIKSFVTHKLLRIYWKFNILPRLWWWMLFKPSGYDNTVKLRPPDHVSSVKIVNFPKLKRSGNLLVRTLLSRNKLVRDRELCGPVGRWLAGPLGVTSHVSNLYVNLWNMKNYKQENVSWRVKNLTNNTRTSTLVPSVRIQNDLVT
jgi:hypothetical protein